MIPRVLLSALLAVSGALAQQQLQLVGLPAGATYEPGQKIDFGTVETTAPKTLAFTLNNNGPDNAVLTKLSVDGAAFTLGRNPAGLTLPVGQSLEFTITFAPPTAGPARLGELWVQTATPASSPSPTLQPQAEYDLVGSGQDHPAPVGRRAGVGPRALARDQPGQQLQLVALPSGTSYAPNDSIDFGAVPTTAPKLLTFKLTNNGPDDAILTKLSAGTVFQVSWPAGDPVGLKLPVGQSLQFTITFAPRTAGPTLGQLVVQIATPASSLSPIPQPQLAYNLSGTGDGPTVWPGASIVVALAAVGSPQQGEISIQFDSALPASGAGTLTMDFTGKGDTQRGFIPWNPPNTLVSQVSFTLAAGESVARFAGHPGIVFATGATATTLTFTATLADGTKLATSQPPPFTAAPVGIDSVILQRAVTCANGAVAQVCVTVGGYDNTRTASAVSFTFYDTAGQQIGQPIPVNATAAFQDPSTGFPQLGTGVFGLMQAFSVTGDVCGIGSVDVSITNSKGPSTPERGTVQPCTVSQ